MKVFHLLIKKNDSSFFLSIEKFKLDKYFKNSNSKETKPKTKQRMFTFDRKYLKRHLGCFKKIHFFRFTRLFQISFIDLCEAKTKDWTMHIQTMTTKKIKTQHRILAIEVWSLHWDFNMFVVQRATKWFNRNFFYSKKITFFLPYFKQQPNKYFNYLFLHNHHTLVSQFPNTNFFFCFFFFRSRQIICQPFCCFQK